MKEAKIDEKIIEDMLLSQWGNAVSLTKIFNYWVQAFNNNYIQVISHVLDCCTILFCFFIVCAVAFTFHRAKEKPFVNMMTKWSFIDDIDLWIVVDMSSSVLWNRFSIILPHRMIQQHLQICKLRPQIIYPASHAVSDQLSHSKINVTSSILRKTLICSHGAI